MSLCGFSVFNPHVVLVPVFFFVLRCSIDPVSPCEVIKIVSNLRRLRPVEEGGRLRRPDCPSLGRYITSVQQHIRPSGVYFIFAYADGILI